MAGKGAVAKGAQQMRAFTVAPWWGLLIVSGQKTIENRSFRVKEGRYLVHCSSCCSPSGYLEAVRWVMNRPQLSGVKMPSFQECRDAAGCVVGAVVVSGWTRFTGDPWWNRTRYGWELRSAERLETPVRARGKLGVWQLPVSALDGARWIGAM